MEKLQKKLTIDSILSDRDMMMMAVLLLILISEGSELPLVLAIAYILLF